MVDYLAVVKTIVTTVIGRVDHMAASTKLTARPSGEHSCNDEEIYAHAIVPVLALGTAMRVVVKTITKDKANKPFQKQNTINFYCVATITTSSGM